MGNFSLEYLKWLKAAYEHARSAHADPDISLDDFQGWVWDGNDPLSEGGWTDVVVTSANLKLPASSAPSTADWKTDFRVLQFEQGDYAHFDGLQLPHGYRSSSPTHPHIHFIPVSDIADGETVVFNMTYTIANPFDIFSDNATGTMTFTNNVETRAKIKDRALSGTTVLADSHMIAGDLEIVVPGLGMSAVMIGNIEYSASSTYSGNIIYGSGDAHAVFDRFGSQYQYSD
jgi:hypothetical protein